MGEVVSRDRLVPAIDLARQAGRTVALADGCFDLLHVGHVRYLQAAGQEADLLVVAVHVDASVRKLQGKGRPILTAEHRAELVAALRWVDFVTVLDEPTIGPLIALLQPDVYCMGPDHAVESAAERDAVRQFRGRVAIVGDRRQHPTTDVATRIASPGAGRGDPPPGEASDP